MEGEQVSAKQIPETFGQDGSRRRINLLYEYRKTPAIMPEVSMACTATRIDDQIVVKGYTLKQ